MNWVWIDYHRIDSTQWVYLNLLLTGSAAAALYTIFLKECEDRKHFLVQHKKNLMNFDRSQLEESESRLRFLVVLDSLTGLANRKSFERGIKMEWNRSGRSRQPVGLLRINIDHFEHLTEGGGEAVESICVQLADVVRGYTRRSGDLAAHVQKGQFALLLPDTDLNSSFQVANKIKEDIRKLAIALDAEGEERLTASIGVTSMIPRPQFMCDEIVKTAEEALRRAQSLGHEQIICL